MSTYHRYTIADGGNTSLDDLHQCLHECNPLYDIEGDAVTFNGQESGIIVDITERGNPIFEDDIDLLARRAGNDPAREEILPRLDRSNCMVTLQVTSYCDEIALNALWDWLRVHKKGILASRDHLLFALHFVSQRVDETMIVAHQFALTLGSLALTRSTRAKTFRDWSYEVICRLRRFFGLARRDHPLSSS
jgi:hypothetical protein